MNLSLSEALERLSKWENAASEVNGMMLPDSSPCVIKFIAGVSVHNEGIITDRRERF